MVSLSGELYNVLVGFSTLTLALLTYLLWQETRKTREYNLTAEIVVTVELNQRYFNAVTLVIENIGLGLAKNVRLELEKPFTLKVKSEKAELKLHELALFNNPIAHLKSGQKIQHHLCMFPDLDRPDIIDLKIKASWQDYRRKHVTARYEANLNYLMGIRKLGNEPLNEIADTQKRIAESIARMEARGLKQAQEKKQGEKKPLEALQMRQKD